MPIAPGEPSTSPITVSSITNTVAVYFDRGNPTVTANAGTGTLTVKTDPGYELGAIKAINSTVAVYFDRGNPAVNIGSPTLTGITNSIAVHILSTNGTITIKYGIDNLAPSNATSTAYERNRVAKASAGVLFALTGYNSSANAQFIQIHNASSQPAEGAVPIVTFTVPGTSNFAYDVSPYGRYFSTGIAITNSTTGPTKTVAYADCWFDIQYL